ncbi:MAG: OmpH family outer membrane protein [Flavobacteriales bacterium]
MKKVLLILSLLVVSFSVQAQDKIGHINSAELLEAMPEYSSLKSQMETFKNGKESQLQSLNKSIEDKIAKLQSEEATLSAAVKEIRVNEIQQLQQKLQSYYQQAETEIQEKQLALLKPVFEKIQNAVNQVAKANGFSYVIDKSVNDQVLMVVYFDDSKDLSAKVKAALGI